MKEEVTPGFYTLGTAPGSPLWKPSPELQTQPGLHTAAGLAQGFSSSAELNPVSNDPG